MKLTVLIPAYNEEENIISTIKQVYSSLSKNAIPHEILVINDYSTDNTKEEVRNLQNAIVTLKLEDNFLEKGFGNAVICGLQIYTGECVAIFMADNSDSPDDLVLFYQTLIEKNLDAVFGSRFIKGGNVIDYPLLKLILNRIINKFIQLVFRINYNDVTNAFKLYKRETIDGLKPFLSPHFNLTVELPLKVIVRNFNYTFLPNTWKNRKKGESKLKIKEMGSRYFFIIFYCIIEKFFSKGDYKKR
jgi:dolichol-phosphate mannosyltransferase